jgi:hypothetical protein
MSLFSSIVLGLFILFCAGTMYGLLANKDETLLKRVGCAAPFALFIVLTFVLGRMDNKREMRDLRKLFGIATLASIMLTAIFRVWDGDTGHSGSSARGTWKGIVGMVFLYIAAVCAVATMVLGIVLDEGGPPEPPEPMI